MDRREVFRRYNRSVKGKARQAKYDRTWKGRTRAVADIENRRAKRRGVEGYVSTAEWRAILIAADGRCHYCGEKKNGTLSMDHVVPLVREGTHTVENIVPACLECNVEKEIRDREGRGDREGCQEKTEIPQNCDRARF